MWVYSKTDSYFEFIGNEYNALIPAIAERLHSYTGILLKFNLNELVRRSRGNFLDKLCYGILNTHIIFSVNLNAIFALKDLLM